jgi:kanamycin kinase
MDAPASIRAVAGDRPIRAVWRSQLGGTTYEVGEGDDRCFVKWAPTASAIDLAAERERLMWAARFACVPAVLDHGRDADGTWLCTRALAGTSAFERKADPDAAVRAIGAGLRALHDALPVEECPFSWSIEQRLAAVRRRAARGEIEWPAAHLGRALAWLAVAPPIERAVVCHGDAGATNTLVGDDGRCTGHVDLGALGVACRWADLAVATWSAEFNFGPGWEAPLLDAYGIALDARRTRYYRLLYQLA